MGPWCCLLARFGIFVFVVVLMFFFLETDAGFSVWAEVSLPGWIRPGICFLLGSAQPRRDEPQCLPSRLGPTAQVAFFGSHTVFG